MRLPCRQPPALGPTADGGLLLNFRILKREVKWPRSVAAGQKWENLLSHQEKDKFYQKSSDEVSSDPSIWRSSSNVLLKGPGDHGDSSQHAYCP
jgi:hypothetical protein